MALSKKQIADMISRYDGGKGEGTSALGDAFDVAPSTVRYHLKAAGVFNPNADEQPLSQTDKELGIGEETAGDQSAAQMAALLANPAMQKLIDAAVAARLTQMGAPAPVAGSQTDQMAAFTASLAHLIEVQSMQQAGYIKPLSAAEVDSRAAGLVEMKALLKEFEAKGTPPEWIVGESGFFECTNALEFMPGQTIRTFLPPVEDFIPNNAQAEKVQAAMLQWIGGHTPGIGEQVEAAMRANNQSAPLVTGTLQPHGQPRPVELVASQAKAAPRKRVAGSIVPERHDVSLAERASGPQGPVFVGDRAVA
jgi:hypothetical protein